MIKQTTTERLNAALLPKLQAFSGNIGVSILARDGSLAWHYNQNEILPVASCMKLFVLGTFLEAVQLGTCSLDDMISFTPSDIIGGSGLLLDMQADTTLSAYNMALLMMVVSDNTATNLLTDLVGGIEVVQAHMRKHGALHSKINRKMSEDPAIMAQCPFALGTTAEYADYLQKVHGGAVLDAARLAIFDELMARGHYKNFVPAYLPLAEDCPACWPDVPMANAVQAACKTGWMLGIRCDVGYLTIAGVEYAYAVLSGDCADLRPTADNEAVLLLNECGQALYHAVIG